MCVFYDSCSKRWIDRLIAACANKKTVRNEEERQERRFLLVETHKRCTSIAVLTVHAETSLLYTFQWSMKANRNINLWWEKAPIYKLSRRKALKTQQICHYRHAAKTKWLFLVGDTSVGFNTCNNFVNLGSFAKVSIPLQFIIPW